MADAAKAGDRPLVPDGHSEKAMRLLAKKRRERKLVCAACKRAGDDVLGDNHSWVTPCARCGAKPCAGFVVIEAPPAPPALPLEIADGVLPLEIGDGAVVIDGAPSTGAPMTHEHEGRVTSVFEGLAGT